MRDHYFEEIGPKRGEVSNRRRDRDEKVFLVKKFIERTILGWMVQIEGPNLIRRNIDTINTICFSNDANLNRNGSTVK